MNLRLFAQAFPERARRVHNGLVELRGARRNNSEFGRRMVGEGPRWEAIRGPFELQRRRLGYDVGEESEGPERSTFRRPSRQGSLFE